MASDSKINYHLKSYCAFPSRRIVPDETANFRDLRDFLLDYTEHEIEVVLRIEDPPYNPYGPSEWAFGYGRKIIDIEFNVTNEENVAKILDLKIGGHFPNISFRQTEYIPRVVSAEPGTVPDEKTIPEKDDLSKTIPEKDDLSKTIPEKDDLSKTIPEKDDVIPSPKDVTITPPIHPSKLILKKLTITFFDVNYIREDMTKIFGLIYPAPEKCTAVSA